MSKITNDSLTRSGTGCFKAVPMLATVRVKGLNVSSCVLYDRSGLCRSASTKSCCLVVLR